MKYFLIFLVFLVSVLHSLSAQNTSGTKRLVHKTLKTIIVYAVNNKTNEIIARIEVKTEVSYDKFTEAEAKVLENNMDKINTVQRVELKIEHNNIILTVLIEDDVGCTLFLGLNKEGNLRSCSPNSEPELADLRFGGVFLEQSKGIFKTESKFLKR
jgi:hypothetical protein